MEYTKSIKYLFYSLPGTFLSIFFLILIDLKLFKFQSLLLSQLSNIGNQGYLDSANSFNLFSNPLVIFAHILVLVLLILFFVAYLNSLNSESLSGLYLLIYSTILGIVMAGGYVFLIMLFRYYF